jgi:hypothetical protein
VNAARYVLPADENTELRVELVIEPAPESGRTGSSLEVAAEVTLNGGRGLSYRPLISGVQWMEATSSLVVRGLHLDAVRRASCLPVGAAVAFPVAANTQLDGTLLAELPTKSIGGSLRMFDDKELVALADFLADKVQAGQPALPEPVIAWFGPPHCSGQRFAPNRTACGLRLRAPRAQGRT